MCSIVGVLAGAAIAGTVAGGIQQNSASKAAAKAARQEGEFNARVAENNAKTADALAADAISRGEVEAQDVVVAARGDAGSQRALSAARGVEVGRDSAALLEKDTIDFGNRDAEIVRANAEREAFAHRTQSSNFTAQARLTRASAENRARALRFQGRTALFGAFTQAAGMGATFGLRGAFNTPKKTG